MNTPKISSEDLKKMGEKLAKAPELDDEEAINPRLNPIESIAESLFMIERHLQAIVYQGHTDRVEGLNYIPENFYSIYTSGLNSEDIEEASEEYEERMKEKTGVKK